MRPTATILSTLLGLSGLAGPALSDPERSRAEGDGAATLIVEVQGLRSDRGQLRALLFRNGRGFPGERGQAWSSTEVGVSGGRAVLRYPELPPGTYALTVFHDENDNAELDMNFLGWPREGVGASRRAHVRLGPPRFEDARFDLATGARTEAIEILYPPL